MNETLVLLLIVYFLVKDVLVPLVHMLRKKKEGMSDQSIERAASLLADMGKIETQAVIDRLGKLSERLTVAELEVKALRNDLEEEKDNKLETQVVIDRLGKLSERLAIAEIEVKNLRNQLEEEKEERRRRKT